MAKVTIIGATGNVGMFAAHAISAIPHVSEILLYGREGRESLLKGITQDFVDSFAARGTDIRINWTTNLKDAAGSDVVVITAGAPRTPEQDRLDLAMGNARIIAPLAKTIGVVAPETKILVVTNPVDVMTCVALKYSQPETQPGVRARDASGFDASEIAYCFVFQSSCQRSPYPYHR